VEIPETEQQEVQQPVIEDKVIAGTEPVMSKTIFPVGSEPTKESRTTVGFSYPIEENNKEIKRKLNKLILSVEMDNWEKAENFATALRNLTTEAPKDVKNAILRIKMAVQKEDYEKTSQNVELLRTLLAEDE
jgi:hypothetical protein